MKFSAIQGVIFDMDGVLWHDNTPLAGFDDLFAWLRESGIPYAFATNNSSKTPQAYVQKFADMGIPDVPSACIFTSAVATAQHLQSRYMAGTRLFVLGMAGIRTALDEAGFDLTEDEAQVPQAVVVGIDFHMTYARLKQATLHIRNGADFIATNADKTYPTPEGLAPGAGSIVAALEAATDQQAEVIGKPARPIFDLVLKYLDTPASNTLMVGDRLDTDIQGGRDAGMKTALLFTGATTPDHLMNPRNDIWADVAYEGLPDLLKAWAGDVWWLARQKSKRGRK
jgi:4-nitrophenyl phosphatase